MSEFKKKCRSCDRMLFLKKFESIGGGQRRGSCRECRKEGKVKPYDAKKVAPPPVVLETPRFFRPLDSKRYLITSAQNNTFVHPEFFKTLKRAAEHLGAELVVIPYRYKNPTGMHPGRDLRLDGLCGRPHKGKRCFLPKNHWGEHKVDELWWDPEVEPYLHNVRKKLHAHLVLAGDVKIQATASSPLTGFESLTGAESCIIGHPKMQVRTVPVPAGRYPKVLMTTGACTERNYSNTKAGALGEFHHFLGAVYIGIKGKRFAWRQINADRRDGSFIDKDLLFTSDTVTKAPPALGLTLGDVHARFIDKQVDAATFGPGGIVETLDVQTVLVEDVCDGYAVNPHHRGNPFIMQAKRLAGFRDVRAEVDHTIEFLRSRLGKRQGVIVSSNHHDFLERWILDEDWKRDPVNAAFYLDTARAMLSSVRMTEKGTEYLDPFKYWIDKAGLKNVRCLARDESFTIAGIECGLHGHQGPNGAKGTLKNLSRIGTRVISGHSHSPGIEEGHYQVGTSTPLKLEYTEGPSSWLNTHCVIYANGKRSLITIIDGEWDA